MCLNIWVEAAASDRDSLTLAAESASRFGLQVAVRHASRWPWARTRPALATVTEDGGCACSMLSDEADWNAETWAIRPELVEPLAQALEEMSHLGPRRITVAALWVGDTPREELDVTPTDLTRLVKTTGLGTKRRYVVEREAA